MKVDLFDFELPPTSIALRPANPRHLARLLQVQPSNEEVLTDHIFHELPQLLQPGDILVVNDTKVIPARLKGLRINRGDTEPSIEVTLHKREELNHWQAFAKPAKKLQVNDKIAFERKENGLTATVIEKGDFGNLHLAFDLSDDKTTLEAELIRLGDMPLPPYIASKRQTDESDLSDYQTLFASKNGAVAAPTAGLHFTPEVIADLDQQGISMEKVTLHVGAGTFLPVKADDTNDHKMHAEWGELSSATAEKLNQARADGRRIIAVGTTSLRLLETAANADRIFEPFIGDTDIFITPGYKFKGIDLLLTNFHLPKSTLFMLVCALSGIDPMKRAYQHAIDNGYRFYSYGDACLLHPESPF